MTDTEGGYLGPQNLVLRFRSRLADEPGVTSFMRCIVRALSMLALVATMVATGFATCASKKPKGDPGQKMVLKRGRWKNAGQ